MSADIARRAREAQAEAEVDGGPEWVDLDEFARELGVAPIVVTRTRPADPDTPVPTYPDVWHGTHYGWLVGGCRCADCRDAHTTSLRTNVRKRRTRATSPQHNVPIGPTRARLETLLAAGVTFPQLAAMTGLTDATLRNIVGRTGVDAGTARVVAAAMADYGLGEHA